jgi:hypothetical protein
MSCTRFASSCSESPSRRRLLVVADRGAAEGGAHRARGLGVEGGDDDAPGEVVRVDVLAHGRHRDASGAVAPFDRMIAVQAIANGLKLMARDAVFDAYGVDRVW